MIKTANGYRSNYILTNLLCRSLSRVIFKKTPKYNVKIWGIGIPLLKSISLLRYILLIYNEILFMRYALSDKLG